MIKRINFLLSSFIGPKLYWHLAGLIHPWEAVVEGVNDPKLLYKQGEGIVMVFKKLKLINKKTILLDIGCGVGRLEYSLARYVYKCIGVDIAPSMINLAKKNVKAKNIEFLETNGKDLQVLKNQNFDLIFSIIVFQHLPKEIFLNYLKESKNLLKKSGKIFFQIPIYSKIKPAEPPKNHPWGLRYYQIKELQKILKDEGFSKIKFFDVLGNKLKGNEDQIFVLASNRRA